MPGIHLQADDTDFRTLWAADTTKEDLESFVNYFYGFGVGKSGLVSLNGSCITLTVNKNLTWEYGNEYRPTII